MDVNIKELSKITPLLDFEHIPNPTWKNDAGRNTNSGKWSGTFAGFFSTINLSFGTCTQEQLNTIKNAFEKATCSVIYPDSLDGRLCKERFYGTAINAKKDYWDGEYKPFKITLTALNPYEERTRL